MAFVRESVKKKLDFDDSALPSSPFSSSSSVSSSASCIWDGGVYAEMVVPKEIELEKVGGLEFKLQIPDVRAATVNFFRSREVGEFFSGALSGAMTKAVLAPLETIRTRMVVGVGSRNIVGSFIEIIEQQGWQGLWAGNTVNMVRIIPTQAIELATFECVKRAVASTKEKLDKNGCPKVQIGDLRLEFSLSWVSPVAVGGAAAGVVSTLICHPLEVLKIYREGGIGNFYAGICPTLIGMIPYSTCYYFMYETMKNSYCKAKNKQSLSRPELLLVGAFSGLTASSITFPLEVARKRLMVGALRGRCPANITEALSEVIQQEGVMGLYRGWAASTLKVMPSSGITWMFYEAWKDILVPRAPV
ncbi:putative adenine nucleotide transporter [Nymphaea thermarum]|nr:putative adenine nucleotide transporter [Nymphaea thermarum]